MLREATAVKVASRYGRLIQGAAALTGCGRRDLAGPALPRPRTGPLAGWHEKIEAIRDELTHSTMYLPQQDKTLGSAASGATVRPPWTDFMYRLVRQARPQRVVEMGTFVGISGAYLAAGLFDNGFGRMVTLDADQQATEIAARNFETLGLDAIVDVRCGVFGDTLEPAVTDLHPVDFLYVDGGHSKEITLEFFDLAVPHLAPGAIVLFDDIRWSDDMRDAWRTVRVRPSVERSAYMGKMGITFIRR